MRKIFLIILLAFSSLTFANMASPYREGTKVASAFTSNDIEWFTLPELEEFERSWASILKGNLANNLYIN